MSEEQEETAYEIDSDGRTIVPLDYPVRLGDKEVSALHMRRIQGKDLRRTRGLDDEQRGLKLISLLSGQLDAVIDEMDAVDLAKCGAVIEGFQMAGRRTGRPRS